MRLKKAIMCLMTAFVAQSMVARVVTVENVKYDIDESGKTAVLTNGRNVNRDYFSIPSSIWYGNITYEVTGIGDEAFSNNKKIKEVAVPRSVMTIGDYTFKNCTQLRNITFEDRLNDLGEGAFYGCSRLNKVRILDRYRSSSINIKKYTFYGCKELDSFPPFSIHDTIGDFAFANCTSLKNIYYFSFLKKIGEKAFYNCRSLEEIFVSSYECDFGASAFGNCVNVKRVEITPNSLGSRCFMNCKSLKTVTFGKMPLNTPIGDSCFMKCYALDTVKFTYCEPKLALMYDFIEDDRKPFLLGKDVFLEANSLNHIYVHYKEVEKYKKEACWAKYADKILPFFRIIAEPRSYKEGLYDPVMEEDGTYDEITYVYGEGQDAKIFIQEDMQLLNYLFLDDRSIKDSMVSRGINTLTIRNVDKDHLLSYQYRDESQRYDFTVDDILYSVNVEEHYAYVRGRKAWSWGTSNLVLPAYVEYQGDLYPVKSVDGMGYGFKMAQIVTISLPNTVEEIADMCFAGNEWLTSVTFDEEHTKWNKIGMRAFERCISLESITLPKSLSSIGEDAFVGCTSLREVKVLSSYCHIGQNAFGDNDSLVIWVPYDQLDYYRNDKNWSKYADQLVPFYTIYVQEHEFYDLDVYSGYYWGVGDDVKYYSYNVFENEYDVPFQFQIGDFVYQIIKDGKYLSVIEGQNGLHLENIKKDVKIKLIMKHFGQEDDVHVGKYFYKINKETKTATVTNRELRISDVVVPASFLYEGERYTVTGVSGGISSIPNVHQTERIELPRMVSKLPSFICYNDNYLEEIVFSENSRLDTIEDEALAYCERIEEITLPSRLRYIGNEAFNGTPLKEVTLYSGICNLGENAFGDVPDDFRIYVPAKYLQHYRSASDWEKYKPYIFSIEDGDSNDNGFKFLPISEDENLVMFDEDEQGETPSAQSSHVNVFNLRGQIVKLNVESANWYENLQDGLYIVEGHKHIVKGGKVFYGK